MKPDIPIGDPANAAGSLARSNPRHDGAGRRRRMHPGLRVLLAVAALLLSLTYFFPLWEISLDAPQYPEGLGLEIWINQMQGQHPGDLNKINNLNHYIGMKHIQPKSIPELKIMPWIMRGVMIIGLIAAATGRRSILILWLLVFLVMAIAGLVDFYMWGYDYGHNLDTQHAIIKVPGMSYQPPLIGSKKLLNFKAISLPGIGGWFAIASFVIGALIWLYDRRRFGRRARVTAGAMAGVTVGLMFLLALGCGTTGPTPIQYGVDQCDYCRMTIADRRFGTELITDKGKSHKYDSIECLAAAELKSAQDAKKIRSQWVTDFAHPGTFLDVRAATFVATERQKSPMGVGLVAVGTDSDAAVLIQSVGGAVVDWNGAKRLVAETWKLSEEE